MKKNPQIILKSSDELDELLAFSEILETTHELRDRFVGLINFSPELFRVVNHSTMGTSIGAAFEPADGVAEFITALRASKLLH